MPGGRPSKYDPAFCDVVIECGKGGKTKAEMAAAIDIGRDTLNEWMDVHPEFSYAVKRGLDLAQSWWENQGRVATFGGTEGFQQTSYIFNMKNRFKEDWSDTVKSELTGKNGGPIEVKGSEKLKSFVDGLAERSGTDSSTSGE